METDESRKLVFVQDEKVGAARPVNVAQVKRHLTADSVEATSVNLSHSFMMELGESLSKFSTASAVSSETDAGGGTTDVHLTEIIPLGDPRTYFAEMTAAKKAEIRILLERKTFKVILKEELPPDGNNLTGRFVLAFNSTEDVKMKHKARYVIRGDCDKFKDLMVHSI